MGAGSGLAHTLPLSATQQSNPIGSTGSSQSQVHMSFPSGNIPINSEKEAERLKNSITDLSSRNPAVVVKGLNILHAKSADFDSHALHLDTYPALLPALCSLLAVVNPIGNMLFLSTGDTDAEYTRHLLSPSGERDYWRCGATLVSDNHLAFKMSVSLVDENQMLQSILAILRNLSFEAANLSPIATSSACLKHLVYMLLIPVSAPNVSTDVVLLAMDTLAHVASVVDIRGPKRTVNQHRGWLEDCCALHKKNPELLSPQSAPLSVKHFMEHYNVVAALLPAIRRLLRTNNREVLLRALEVLQGLAQMPDNSSVIAQCPGDVLDAIVSMLCVTNTSGETVGQDQLTASGADSRPPGCCWMFLDLWDVELRDAALEALAALVSGGRLVERLSGVTGVFRILKLIVESSSRIRTESTARASEILSALLMHPNVSLGSALVVSDLRLTACSDDLSADLVCNRASVLSQSLLQDLATDIPPTLPTTSIRLTL